MKRLLVVLSVGVLALGMIGCGSGDSESGSSPQPQVSAPTPDPTQIPEISDTETGGSAGGSSAADNHDYSQGWTDEMNAVKTAVTDLLGENYFPNMPLDPEMLEGLVGISSDMYEDYLAEIPMISTNVDVLIVVKPAEGQADAVEEALNAYRDAQVSNTMQYPQNVGKIQASKVDRVGDYVVFVLLGGDVMEYLEQGDEAVITYCQEVNDNVIEAIRGVMQ